MNHSEQEFFVSSHFPVNDGTMNGMETAYNSQLASGSQSIACPICLRVTQFPVRHDCGHVLCWSCMQQSLSSLGDCPLCHAQHIINSGTRNTIPAIEDVSDADIEREFTPASVLDKDEFFMTNPPQDASARRALKIKIIVRRPQVNLINYRAGRREQDETELNRRNVIYFVRLAPLTVKVGPRQWMASPAGSFFSALEERDDVYQYRDQYAAMYGFTTTTAATRFSGLRSELRDKGFPEPPVEEGYSPFYALCIDGLPGDHHLLERMESGLRNLFGRQGLRLRQHARGIQHPVLAEAFEFVCSDELCDTPFDLFQRYANRLNAAQRCVLSIVQTLDTSRDLQLRRARTEILRRYGSDIDDIVEDSHAQAVLEEELEAVEDSYPRLNVRHLYFSVLEYASATI